MLSARRFERQERRRCWYRDYRPIDTVGRNPGRGGVELARPAVGSDHVPDHLARPGVERDEMSVSQPTENPTIAVRHATPKPPGSWILQFMVAHPSLDAGARVNRIGIQQGG